MRIHPALRRYRPRLFNWCTADDLGTAALLIFIGWLCVYVLPGAAAHNAADDLRARLREAGFIAVEGR